MSLQNFDATKKTVPKFINFCECLKNLKMTKGGDNKPESPTEDKGKHKCNNDQMKLDDSKEKYCILHGQGSHTSSKCRDLKKMVKKHKHSNPNYKKDSKKDYKPKQGNINTMVIEAMKAIKAKKTKEKEKVQAELSAFESISLLDTDKSVDTRDS